MANFKTVTSMLKRMVNPPELSYKRVDFSNGKRSLVKFEDGSHKFMSASEKDTYFGNPKEDEMLKRMKGAVHGKGKIGFGVGP